MHKIAFNTLTYFKEIAINGIKLFNKIAINGINSYFVKTHNSIFF